MDDRVVGVWLPEHGDGLLLVTGDGWYALQLASGLSSAGHYGIDGDRFLLDPVVASDPVDVGRVQTWGWSFDGDVLVLAGPGAAQRWQRETAEVVTGLGTE